MMNPNLLTMLGLILSLVGVITLACGLIISRKQALKVCVSRVAEDSDEENLCLPHVRDEMRESKFALIGTILMAIGFLLQIAAVLLSR